MKRENILDGTTDCPAWCAAAQFMYNCLSAKIVCVLRYLQMLSFSEIDNFFQLAMP